jgi:hypothetical protein
VRAQEGWVLKKDENGIKVYTRSAERSKFNELRVETVLPATLSSLAALILDISHYPRWSFNTLESHILRRVGPSELYFYSRVHSPWPASDRDLAVHLRVRQDSATRVMTVTSRSVPNFIPPKKDLVRVPLSDEVWTVTPLPGGKIRIDYRLQIDPGTDAPAWLINSFSTKGPYETFSRLREELKQAPYRDARSAFIKD